MPAGGFLPRSAECQLKDTLSTDNDAWDALYGRYERDCAGWGVEPLPLAEFEAYWRVFADDGELAAMTAPIMGQRL